MIKVWYIKEIAINQVTILSVKYIVFINVKFVHILNPSQLVLPARKVINKIAQEVVHCPLQLNC
jgi:hypothetical protein